MRYSKGAVLPAIIGEGDSVVVPEGGQVTFVRHDGKGRVRVRIDAQVFHIDRANRAATPPPRGTHRA